MKKAVIKRLAGALAIAAVVALPFLVVVDNGAARSQFVTSEQVPQELVDDVANFARRLNVPVPQLRNSTLECSAIVHCSKIPGDCDIQLGTRFSQELQTRAERASVLAHEMGHVRQSAGGELFSHSTLTDVFFFSVLATLAFVSPLTGYRQLVGLPLALCGIVWLSFFNGVIAIDSLSFRVIAAALVMNVFFLLYAAISKLLLQAPLSFRRILLSVIGTALIGAVWFNVRMLDDGMQRLEREADQVSACLVGKTARRLVVSRFVVYERGGGGWIPDLAHPTAADRVATIDALDAQGCAQFGIEPPFSDKSFWN